MIVLRLVLLLNWAVVFGNSNLFGGGHNSDDSGNEPITQPFAFQTWSDMVKDSKDSSKELRKNPVSYSNKPATAVEIILEPLRMSKIDPDENVSLENDD